MSGLAAMSRRAMVPTSTKSSGVPTQGFLPSLGSTPSAAGVYVSQGTAMAVSAVYACVTIRAEDVARCTPALWRTDASGNRVKVTDHPLAKLLKKPNRQQSWFEFAEQMHAAVLLRSNAYAAIRRDRRGNPIELIPINPDAVQVLEGIDGHVFYQVNRIGLFQMAMLRDFPTAIPSEDVLHIRGLSFNMLIAASRIALARDAIGVSMGLEQQSARWMANGARPAGVLETEKVLTDGTATRLKAQWDSLFSGLQNVGSTAILEQGLKWRALQLSSVDLEFIAQRKFQVEDIARFFKTPLWKIGVSEGARNLDYAKAGQDYVNNVVSPDLDRWEQRFSFTFDLDAEDIEMDMDEERLLRSDAQTRYANYRVGILSGYLKPNEARAKEKLPGVEGGDRLFVPANAAALGSDATGTAPDGAGRPEAGRLPKPGVSTAGDQPGTETVED